MWMLVLFDFDLSAVLCSVADATVRSVILSGGSLPELGVAACIVYFIRRHGGQYPTLATGDLRISAAECVVLPTQLTTSTLAWNHKSCAGTQYPEKTLSTL